jgi:hypothetical protein
MAADPMASERHAGGFRTDRAIKAAGGTEKWLQAPGFTPAR